jgi:hypothetical protein
MWRSVIGPSKHEIGSEEDGRHKNQALKPTAGGQDGHRSGASTDVTHRLIETRGSRDAEVFKQEKRNI